MAQVGNRIVSDSVPNLDCMDPSDLRAFARKYEANRSRAVAAALVGYRPGYIKIARNLGHYAWNKSVAMQLRSRGDIATAQAYEAICDRIYQSFPTDIAW